MAEFTISIRFNTYVHLGQIQYFFKALKTNFKTQYFQYRVGTLKFTGSYVTNLCQLISLQTYKLARFAL